MKLTRSIQRNLLLKKLRGNYDRAKARKLFKYLADSAAQRYHKEFGVKGQGSSFGPFSAEDRRQVAAALEEEFHEAVDNGDLTAEQIGLKIPKTVQKQLNQRLAGLSGKGPKISQRSLDRGR